MDVSHKYRTQQRAEHMKRQLLALAVLASAALAAKADFAIDLDLSGKPMRDL